MKCETIPDVERFLSIQEQALGPTAPEVAATLHKLAGLYHKKGNLDKAEEAYVRAYEIRNNYQGLHRQGIEETEARLEEIRKIRAGLLHPVAQERETVSVSATAEQAGVVRADAKLEDTAKSVTPESEPAPGCGQNPEKSEKPAEKPADNFRISQQNANGMRMSRPCNPQAIQSAIQESEIEVELLKQMVGADNPAVADLLTKIADLYCRLRRYSEMEPLLIEALKIREAACGPEHPSLATELKNLGLLYCAQERYALAEPLIKRAITLRQKHLGKSHARVADLEEQYAQLLRRTNRAAQAEALERHVKEIRNGRDSATFNRNNSFFNAAG